MTAPHQSSHQSAVSQRPYPQEPHRPQQQPTHPPVAPGQQLRPWPVNPEQQHLQHGRPEQPHRLPRHPQPHPGRHTAEELRRAQARVPGSPGGAAEPAPPPVFVREQQLVGLAVAAFVLGIVGVVGGVVGALVGSAMPVLKYVTIGLAAVGALLGLIAILGTRKVLAGIGTFLCAGAIVVAMTAQVAADPESGDHLGGADAAAQDVALRDCSVVREGADARAEVTLEITNRTDQRQSYNITVTVNARGGPRVGEVQAISTAVAPGQSVVLSGPQASGTVVGSARTGPADCRVAEVNRLALGR